MLSRKSQVPQPAHRHSAVQEVKESYWRALQVLQQSNELYLCEMAQLDPTCERPRYELVYRASRIFSLCRIRDLDTAQTRFHSLQSIFRVMLHPSSPNRGTSFIMSAFQKVINTVVQYPSWLDVHISAYNGFVDFFKKTKLEAQRINAQREPDLCTPLHLAIAQGFSLTVNAILALEPDLALLDSERNSVLHFAVLSRLDILNKILRCSNIRPLLELNNKRRLNPIELACYEQKIDNFRSLMAFGLTARMLSVMGDSDQGMDNQLTMLASIDNQRVVKFTKEDLDNFDLSRIKHGGCPLHWAQSTAMIEKLLKDQFNINTPNRSGQTALWVMVRKQDFRCALTLLYSGAHVNVPDATGDSPLLVAVRNAHSHLVRCLLVFDADVNTKDAQGHSALHLAATGTQAIDIVEMLKTLGAHPCQPNSQTECVKECILNEPVERIITSPKEFPFSYSPNHQLLAKRITSSQSQFTEHTTPASNSSPNQKRSKKARLINFDGGGIKGLFTVQLMMELDKYLHKELHHYFDWISGTSTGSLVAFMIARGNSLKEVRRLYFQFKDKIMTGGRPYREDNFELLLQNELGTEFRMSDALTQFGKHVLVMSARVDHSPPSLRVFRSFSYPGTKDPLVDIKAWKALRASSAAPTYFRSYYPYIDGGVLSNNPTLDALTEFYRYRASVQLYNRKPDHPKLTLPELELVLSFGNGQIKPKNRDLSSIFNKLYYVVNLRSSIRDLNRAPATLKGLADQIKALVTNCNDNVVFRADSWCSSLNVLYYRLNPLMSRKYSLNETDDIELIKGLWDVKVYAHQYGFELRRLAQVIDCMEARASAGEDCHPLAQ